MTALAQPTNRLYAVPAAPDIEFQIEAARPLLPDGVYMAVCNGCDAKQVFGVLKVFVRFRIVDPPHEGVEVFRAFRVRGRIVPGKGPGSGPRPVLRRSGDLFKTLCRVLNLPPNARAYRVGYRELRGKLCKVQLGAVTKDYKQKPHSSPYSVVKEVLSLEAG